MKPVFLLTILSSLGFTFSMSIMPTLAGSVPVGAASGVTLPTSLDTSNISPPIIPPPEIATPTAETPPTQTTPAAPIISPDTQVILNQTASQTLGEIQVTAPVVADTVISTTPVVVSSPVNEITITTNNNSTVPSTPITV
ncbi:hypothetical protein FHL01_01605, partial [Cylindrospermopsis raciborskii CS-506_C]